jgi:hypothetical protein
MQTPFFVMQRLQNPALCSSTWSYLFPRARSRLYNGKHCMKRDSLLCFVSVFFGKLSIHNCKLSDWPDKTYCTLQKLVNKIFLCTRKSGACVKTNSPAQLNLILNFKIGAFPFSYGCFLSKPFLPKDFLYFVKYIQHIMEQKIEERLSIFCRRWNWLPSAMLHASMTVMTTSLPLS